MGGFHLALWQFLATSSLIFGAWYLWWRWTASLNWSAAWFSVPLLIAETAAFLGLILFTINIWSIRDPKRGALPEIFSDTVTDQDKIDRPIAVDVFFTTYNEDVELVRLGLRDARRFEYPHPIDLRVHVLDDGRRPEMQQVAAEEGANYITRSDNVGYKAGNLRNAMEVTSGDFVVICDADTRPFPNLLTETLGYFRDPKVAWVQTPQWFWDIPPGVPLAAWLERRAGRPGRWLGNGLQHILGPMRIGEDPFANDAQMFYDVILRRRNRVNASFCCGAASVHRREAIMEASIRAWALEVDEARRDQGRAIRRVTKEKALSDELVSAAAMTSVQDTDFTPFKLHVSEDIYTSIILHEDRERGWKSVLHPVVVSRMKSPSDLLSWTVQRFKYAGGTLDILRNDNPILRRGLTFGQKLMYGSTFYSYLSALWNVVFIIAPVVFLLTGIAPVATYSLEFFLHIVPFLLLNELAQLVGLWGTDTMKGRRWHIAMFPLNLSALWAVARGRRISFPVTPKDRTSGRFLRLARWQIVLSLATLVGLVVGWLAYLAGTPGYSLGAIIANTVWGLNNVLSMLPIIRAAVWQPDPVHELPIMERFRNEPA
ncbi:glycosyltransferase [Fuscibacter oryzae]|uniref:Glycosyltransferase n=1 Tax=Fuscibacter oryzae TaxID=2803939 RepID=A0A8J7SSN9_9RHOB|nr:glycosyltransferase [Fuscibacter oryzae]MBL4928521.1 glycosyltransferase [Fuscibacter oryzae]